MTLYAILFYLLAVQILAATALAVTRRNLVHSIIYLVLSFFGTALLFYLFGAPLLAALEVIIYAGAIMVLFLFIVMMLRVDSSRERLFAIGRLIPAAVMGIVYAAVGMVLMAGDLDGSAPLQAALAPPREFGRYVFQQHWLAVEIASVLLLIALVGALHIGKTPPDLRSRKSEEGS